MRSAFEGITVLDMSHVVAGPYCTMLMGDLGANVIKIEPLEGDLCRTFGPPFQGGESSVFLSVNRNKRSLSINLSKVEGQNILTKLAKEADVIVESFRPDVTKKIGLDYDSLRQINPSVIYCSLSAFGERGPYKNRPGIDPTCQAMAGLVSVTGYPDGPPVKVGAPVVDIAAGILAFSSIITGLFVRERQGIGQRVGVSLLDATLAIQSSLASLYFATGSNPEKLGTATHFSVPSKYFKTRDNLHISTSGFNNKFWSKLLKVLQLEYLAEDPRFKSNSDRVRNRHLLEPIIEDRFMEKSCEDWLKILAENGLPVSPILSYQEVFEHPQVKDSQIVKEIDHSLAGIIRMIGTPINLQHTPGQIRRPPPILGEHTKEILLDFGYKKSVINKLVKDEIVGVCE